MWNGDATAADAGTKNTEKCETNFKQHTRMRGPDVMSGQQTSVLAMGWKRSCKIRLWGGGLSLLLRPFCFARNGIEQETKACFSFFAKGKIPFLLYHCTRRTVQCVLLGKLGIHALFVLCIISLFY